MKKGQLLGIFMAVVAGMTMTACGEKKEENAYVQAEMEKEDLSQFEGTWFNDSASPYDSVTFDKEGNWEMYSNGEVISSGTMEYVQKDDCYYAYNALDGTELHCYVEENGTIVFDEYGAFASENSETPYVETYSLDSYRYYYDLWYKDGNLEETSLLLDETGVWEVYDAMGVIGKGTFEIDQETHNAIKLMDEAGESAALITIDNNERLAVEVYNEELMKLPQTCTLYRESDSK